MKKWFKCKYSDTIKAMLHNETEKDKYSCNIHDIKVMKRFKTVYITIKLGMPGLFIGKAGHRIDRISKSLKDRIKKEIVINLIDFDPFSSIWYKKRFLTWQKVTELEGKVDWQQTVLQ